NRGFEGSQDIIGGDDDLFIGKTANKRNTAICLIPETWVYSIPKGTWRELFRQKIRHLSVGKKYSISNKIKGWLYPVSLIFVYFSTLSSLLFNLDFTFILSIFILRTLIFIVILALITRKLGEIIKWYLVPVLDLTYLIYYLTTGVAAIF